MDLNYETKSRILQSIEESEPWERIKTDIEGVNLVKAPPVNNKEIVFIEFKPDPSSKKSILIKSLEEYLEFKKLFTNIKAETLINTIDELYSTNERKIRLEFTEGDD